MITTLVVIWLLLMFIGGEAISAIVLGFLLYYGGFFG